MQYFISKIMWIGVLSSLTLSCRTKDIAVDNDGNTNAALQDNDFDGYTSDVDCDDFSFAVHPDAIETCDGIDNNCDGEVDENVRSTYYEDADGDGFGSDSSSVDACALPEGYVPLGNDCDDTNPEVFVGALEICNDFDDDCDGQVDEDLLVGLFYDADGDGYGDPNAPSNDCTGGDGYVFYGTDCDDSNPDVHPFQDEVCDGIDNNCSGVIDDGTTLTFFADVDGDGYGDTSSTTQACIAPPGYVPLEGDCDDTDGEQYPNAQELCNQEDDDCDGTIDEDPLNPPTWYYDIDGDGYGSTFITNNECTPPPGYLSDNTDCDDTNTTIYPNAPEYCNNLDNDCNGLIDDSALDAQTWYADIDRDNFGDAGSVLVQCDQPFDYILTVGDCDDSRDEAYPNAPELCNGLDEDCDGQIDENTIDSFTYFADLDGDGFGDANNTLEECQAPFGFVLDDTDCDDGDGTIYPNAQEFCDGIDQNCNGIDFYEEDLDNDGLLACEQSVWVRNSSQNPINPDGNGSQAGDILKNLGVTVTQYNHANNFITISLLQDYGLYIHHGKNPNGAIRAYTNAEAGALDAWVQSGGRFLYIGFHNESDCDIADSLPAGFGLSCTPSNGGWSGNVASFIPHPVTDGLLDIAGTGGDFWSTQAPAQVLASINGRPFVIASEYGEGKIVVVGNQYPFDNAGQQYTINYGDNMLLVENIWDWLLE